MFSYVVKGRDEMFPGRPNLYFYGWGASQKTPNRTVAQFGYEVEKALVVEASTKECAKMVADILANGVRSPSIKTWVSLLVPLEEEGD